MSGTPLKCIKDPLYGYIRIPVDVVYGILDTSVFQRLRRIAQTSYSPLYPSATHTRFVHSLGVYHLGCLVTRVIDGMVIAPLRKESKERKKEIANEFERCLEVFELACLLHDVGHAPFSHTGEDFFLENGKYTKLHAMLSEAIGNAKLAKEFNALECNGNAAKPHEIMSSIVALREFPSFLKRTEERELLARAICGYNYKFADNEVENSLVSFKNCLIALLNSSFIDVDKLDYLIRDAYLIGFQTASIDYKRLLGSIRLRCNNKGHYSLAYDKNAVSVFENVVYAHDAERKWIQNHPVVKYETDLLQRAISDVVAKFGTSLFSYKSLVDVNGHSLKMLSSNTSTPPATNTATPCRVRFLCDADLVFLMKNTKSENVDRYFDRTKWYKPLWKSEVEYKALFSPDKWTGDELSKFRTEIDLLVRWLSPAHESCMFDQEALSKLMAEKKKLKTVRDRREIIDLHMAFLNCLKCWAKDNGINFKFLFLRNSSFVSGFSKAQLGNQDILLPMIAEPMKLKDLSEIIKTPQKGQSDPGFCLFFDCGAELRKSPDIGKTKATLVQSLLEQIRKFLAQNNHKLPKAPSLSE